MIDLEFIEALIRVVDESGVDSIEIERGGTRIRVSKSPAGSPVVNSGNPSAAVPMASAPAPALPGNSGGAGPAPPSAPEAPEEVEEAEEDGLVEVSSPMVGTFYRAPSPDSDPYVEVGDRVSEGDTLCIIEAMKLMNELECEVSGVVAEVLVANAEPVEYGQALFKVRPGG